MNTATKHPTCKDCGAELDIAALPGTHLCGKYFISTAQFTTLPPDDPSRKYLFSGRQND